MRRAELQPPFPCALGFVWERRRCGWFLALRKRVCAPDQPARYLVPLEIFSTGLRSEIGQGWPSSFAASSAWNSQ